MTVYYQFGSRRGLFEALFDTLAAGGDLPAHLATAFQETDAEDALAGVVLAFARFWQAGRPWIRRIRALGVLDRELGEALEARNARRRQAVGALVERLAPRAGGARADSRAETEAVLYTLTSFETFDTLAGPDRTLEEVSPAVLRLARAAAGLPGDR